MTRAQRLDLIRLCANAITDLSLDAGVLDAQALASIRAAARLAGAIEIAPALPARAPALQAAE